MEDGPVEIEMSCSPPPALPPPKRNPRKSSVRTPNIAPSNVTETRSPYQEATSIYSEDGAGDFSKSRKPVPLPRKSKIMPQNDKVGPHTSHREPSHTQTWNSGVTLIAENTGLYNSSSSLDIMTDLDEPVENEDGYLDYEGVRVTPNTFDAYISAEVLPTNDSTVVRTASLVSSLSSNLIKWESVDYLTSSLEAMNFHQSDQDPDIWSVYESDNIPPGYSPPIPPAEDELLEEPLIDVPPPPLPPRPTRSSTVATEIEKSRPALPLPAGRASIIQLESEERNGVATLRGGFLTLRLNQKDVGKRWCVLKDGKLSIYVDRKSVTAKLTIPCSDILDIAVDKASKLPSFLLSALKDRNRPVSFVAESESEMYSWMRALAKCVCDSLLLHMAALKAGSQNFDVASRIFVKNGVSGSWRKSWMELRGRTLTIVDEESGEQYDLRKAVALNIVNIEYYESKADVVCAEASEESKPFILNMPGRTLYFQGDVEKSTAQWIKLIQQRSRECGAAIEDQPLTSEDVPVIVQKCIAFVERHGLKTEGIYRHSGVSSRIAAVLDCFAKDAHACHLSLENFTVHDVSGALKRFLRTLPEPLIKFELFQPLLHCSEIPDVNQKLQKYKSLLQHLPRTPNYVTLKKVCGHLRLVSESDNKMPVQNIAASFGSTIMSGGIDTTTLNSVAGNAFESSKSEITVLIDFLTFYEDLFDVKEEDMIKERKILKALENFNQHMASPPRAGDFLMGVYWIDRKGDAVNLRISSRMTAAQLCQALLNKENMTVDTESYVLHEILFDDKLTRVVMDCEEVIPIILRWTAWNESNICPYSLNYLCVRKNALQEKAFSLARNPISVFQQLRFSKEKSFKKVSVELGKMTLTCSKSSTGEKSLGSWNVQNCLVFRGCSPQRSPPSKWSFTFIEKDNFMDRLKENRNAFGYTICCDEETDVLKWLTALTQVQKLALTSYSSTPTLRAANSVE